MGLFNNIVKYNYYLNSYHNIINVIKLTNIDRNYFDIPRITLSTHLHIINNKSVSIISSNYYEIHKYTNINIYKYYPKRDRIHVSDIMSNMDVLNIQSWYKNGLLDRSKLPAVIFTTNDGTILAKYWFKNGLLHRDGNLPSIIFKNLKKRNYGDIEKYYKNGIMYKKIDKYGRVHN